MIQLLGAHLPVQLKIKHQQRLLFIMPWIHPCLKKKSVNDLQNNNRGQGG
jgi:hypothetical protein